MPGSRTKVLKDHIVEMYEKIIVKKVVFVCGDSNSDLLNQHWHKGPIYFINTMFSVG